MKRSINSKNVFSNSSLSILQSFLSCSLWPLDESIAHFFRENRRVYESDHHWTYLRNVCVDTSSTQLYLYKDLTSYAHLPFSLASLQSVQESDVTSPSHFSWLFFASSEYDVLFPQLALLHAVAVHPDRYPPVHSSPLFHCRQNIFTLQIWNNVMMTCCR